MMESIPIKVTCHAGYKADEYPQHFSWGDIDFDVEEILDRWYESYQNTDKNTIFYYKVKTKLSGIYMMKHEVERDRWYLML